MNLNADLLIISGFVTAALCLAAFCKWRGRMVPVHANTFVAMAMGAGSIGLFYIGVRLAAPYLVIGSRVLWFFILASTAVMALAAIFTARRLNGE